MSNNEDNVEFNGYPTETIMNGITELKIPRSNGLFKYSFERYSMAKLMPHWIRVLNKLLKEKISLKIMNYNLGISWWDIK